MKTTLPDASTLTAWRKSRHSENGEGGCVEVSYGHPDGIPVRDSKTPHGPAVIFAPSTWSTFVTALQSGELGG